MRKIILSLLVVFVFAAAPALAQDESAVSRQPLVSMPSFAPLVEKVEAAVVNISATRIVKSRQMTLERNPFGPGLEDDLFDRFFGPRMPRPDSRERKEHSLGTGFIFDQAGFIITNNHVVEGAEDIKIKLSGGEEIKADIIGRDPKTDLAILKLKKEGKYPFIALGDSDQIKIGDWVVAIGNPFGLDHTVTAGILSARGRYIGAGPYDDFLQFDAAINPGNSGGPLLNVFGEVIGINSAIASASGGNVGIGFAIPSKLAKTVVEQLKEKGKVTRGWIGVGIQKVSPDMAKSFGLNEARGALVREVAPEGPSEGKLKAGDIVLNFDGKDIRDVQDLSFIVANTEVGKKTKVVVFRDKKEIILEITVAEMKDDPADVSTSSSEAGKLGLTLQGINPDIASRLKLSEKEGLYIAGIEPGSPAAEAGFNVGDVVKEIDNQPIKTNSDYVKAVSGKKKGDIIRFLVKRGNNAIFLTISIEE